jgi:catechol 2,3-dioxygenase-like lactoylglutathione lyase family enzyme
MTTRPAGVARLGHVVLGVSDLQATWDWWRSRFALLMSDEVRTPDGIMIAAFIRLDRGAIPTDHHSLNFATMPGRPPAFHHAAFEVADLDDLMVGHEHLKQAGYQQLWGVGRHILGSQVFDYWRDPGATASSTGPMAMSFPPRRPAASMACRCCWASNGAPMPRRISCSPHTVLT